MIFLELLFDSAVYFVNSQLFTSFGFILLAFYVLATVSFLISYLLRRS